MEFQTIEPAVLTALAEMAIQEEKKIQNPYLKALMTRLESPCFGTESCSGK